MINEWYDLNELKEIIISFLEDNLESISVRQFFFHDDNQVKIANLANVARSELV